MSLLGIIEGRIYLRVIISEIGRKVMGCRLGGILWKWRKEEKRCGATRELCGAGRKYEEGPSGLFRHLCRIVTTCTQCTHTSGTQVPVKKCTSGYTPGQQSASR